jgi:LacI family transcriptional regulator
MARPKGPATVTDIARAARVSTATAARALGNYGHVGIGYRNRVEKAARELGYRPNALARSMVTGKTSSIGLVIADIENPFFARATRAVTDQAHAAGYEVILLNTDEDLRAEQAAVKVLLDKRVDGIIIAPASPTETAHLRDAIDSDCPVVQIDRRVKGLATDTVLVDNRNAARNAVHSLAEVGHRRIALMSGLYRQPTNAALDTEPNRADVTTGQARLAGFQAGLKDLSLPENPSYVRFGGPGSGEVQAEMLQLLACDPPPTALIAADCLIALAALQTIKEAKLSVPADMSLVAFDETVWTEVLTPTLSAVALVWPCSSGSMAPTDQRSTSSCARATSPGTRFALPGPPTDCQAPLGGLEPGPTPSRVGGGF